jgi:hypothetical protein
MLPAIKGILSIKFGQENTKHQCALSEFKVKNGITTLEELLRIIGPAIHR